ncbi:MAG: hypothetical protein N2319_04790 [Candidatus Kapabacteria bacterium]|nr:hypothetical protein [Candidatus Kapabacteria bacterium]
MPEYINKYQEILSRLNSTARKESTLILLEALIKILTFGMIISLSFSLVELIMNGDKSFRFILFFLSLSTLFVLSVKFLIPFFSRTIGSAKPNPYSIALRVGNYYPEIKDRLCNTLQLVGNINISAGTSESLTLAAFEEVSKEVKGKDFNVIIEKSKLKKSLIFFLITFIITVLSFTIFQNSLGFAFYRVVNYNQSFNPPAPFKLYLEPLNKTVLRGENVKITVKTSGNPPEKINLIIKENNQENPDSYNLKLDKNNNYVFEIATIKNSIEYYAEAEWLTDIITTDKGKINVIDLPLIKSLTGKLIYPSYTNLGARNIDEQTTEISALIGSRLDFSLLSNKDIKDAKIFFVKNNFNTSNNDLTGETAKELKNDTVIIGLKSAGNRANGGFTINQSGVFHFEIADKDGQKSTNPIKYNVLALTDEYPRIELIDPTTDVQIGESALLPVRLSVSDDYGITSLKLYYKLLESRYSPPDPKYSNLSIPLLSNETSMEVPYLWDLKKIDISPGDIYEFYFEVADNDRVRGPKTARTKSLLVRLPSIEEALRAVDTDQKKIEEELKKVLKESNELKKQMDELDKELLKNQYKPQLDWKDKKKAEDILKKKEEIQKKFEQIQQSLDQLNKSLQDNNVLSPETVQKFLELQKLMEEVDSPELRKMQEAMQQAMDKMSPEDLKKAMQNYKFDEERFRQSIERTLKILKRLQAEQKADALSKMAEELTKKQEELNKQLNNTNPSDKQKRDELAKQQDKLNEDLKNISDNLKSLEDLMKEIGDNMPMKELQDAKDALNENETSDAMQEASKDMQSGDFNKADSKQKKASSNLKKFAENMNKLKNEMNDRVTQEAIRKMQKATTDMLKLSQMQEDLRNQTKNSDYNSTKFNELAENQAQISSAMSNLVNSMMDLANKTFAVTPEMAKDLGDALQKMQQAMQSLANRQTSNASRAQQDAMSSMNQAAMQMQQMLSMMQNQGSGACENPGGSGPGKKPGQQPGMGFMERLQQLAAQQQMINQSLQKLSGQGGGLSDQQRNELGRIAGDQGKAQKTLEELAKEQKQFSGERLALGDLEKIAKEMKEVMTDLQSGNITPETLKRQERILSRLLDATKSINERDYEKKRESRTGIDVIRKSPDALKLMTDEDRKRTLQDILRNLKEGYSTDYENIIKKYFEQLQQFPQ